MKCPNLSFIAVLGLFCGLFFWGCNQRQKDFESFQTEVRATIDPQKLQDWAVPMISQREIGDSIPLAQLPNFLKTKRGVVDAEIYALASVKGRVMFINWSNGLGHWGLLVGDKNYLIPRSEMDGSTKYYDWVPGVYFYLETK